MAYSHSKQTVTNMMSALSACSMVYVRHPGRACAAGKPARSSPVLQPDQTCRRRETNTNAGIRRQTCSIIIWATVPHSSITVRTFRARSPKISSTTPMRIASTMICSVFPSRNDSYPSAAFFVLVFSPDCQADRSVRDQCSNISRKTEIEPDTYHIEDR